MAQDSASAGDLLEVYLNDHLAGSAAALDLVERIRSQNEGTDLAAFLTGLRPEIEADKATLETIMERLGVATSSAKQLAGRVLEKLSRIRLDERVTGGPAVTRLMELESLSLGIDGKLALCRSLQRIAPAQSALAEFDFAALADRVTDQRDSVEPHRLAAAAEAFSSPA